MTRTRTERDEPRVDRSAARARSERRERRRRRSRVLLPILGTIAALTVLLVGVLPTRAVLAQRAEERSAAADLAAIEAANDELAARVAALRTNAEIARLAREQYNLVFAGEEAYVILPAPEPPAPVSEVWPFRALADAVAASAGGATTPS